MNEKQLSQKAYILRAREAFCKICKDKKCCDELGIQDIGYRNKCGKLLEFSMVYKELITKEWNNIVTKKQCSQCKKVYSVKYFRKAMGTIDGYNTRCVNCCNMKRSLKAENKQDVKRISGKIKEVHDLECLINKCDGIKYNKRDLIAMKKRIRYKYDDEYREKIKLLSKQRYYSKDQLYLAKKYLKRHLLALDEAEEKLEKLQENIRKDGIIYKHKISELKLKDKIEILNSKIVLERSVIEKSLPQKKEELEKMGVKNLSFKSILKKKPQTDE